MKTFIKNILVSSFLFIISIITGISQDSGSKIKRSVQVTVSGIGQNLEDGELFLYPIEGALVTYESLVEPIIVSEPFITNEEGLSSFPLYAVLGDIYKFKAFRENYNQQDANKTVEDDEIELQINLFANEKINNLFLFIQKAFEKANEKDLEKSKKILDQLKDYYPAYNQDFRLERIRSLENQINDGYEAKTGQYDQQFDSELLRQLRNEVQNPLIYPELDATKTIKLRINDLIKSKEADQLQEAHFLFQRIKEVVPEYNKLPELKDLRKLERRLDRQIQKNN